MEQRKNIIIAFLSALVVVNMVATAGMYFELTQTRQEVENLKQYDDELSEYFLRESEDKSVNGSQFSSVQTSDKRLSGPVNGELMAYESGGEGRIIPFTFQPLPTNKIYVDASDATVGGEFQESLRIAQKTAENTEYEPVNEGYAVSLNTPTDWEYFKGGSAGLAFTMYIAATDPEYKIKDDVGFTGRVDKRGGVLSVQKIEAKAKAAEENGYDVLVAPYHPDRKSVDGIKIVEVQSVEEALDYALVKKDNE